MSKKNSNVILKDNFKNSEEFSKVYLNFKQKFKRIKSQPIVIAISGGPDSLALAALSKAYSHEKKIKFYYVLVDHRIRKHSSIEANKVKKLLKKKSNFFDHYYKLL